MIKVYATDSDQFCVGLEFCYKILSACCKIWNNHHKREISVRNLLNENCKNEYTPQIILTNKVIPTLICFGNELMRHDLLKTKKYFIGVNFVEIYEIIKATEY